MTELPANPEALLAETAWLRRMAGELTRDPSGADDLSQETMLAALGQPAPTRAGLRTWLESIARRLNARSHRSSYRRKQRERVAAKGEAIASTAQVFDQFNLHRDVVQAVMELKEPVRAVVLMRFWEGLPPRKIASRLDLPVETVRSRIKRGLAQLRGKLDRDYGKRSAWAMPLLALPIGQGASITPIALGVTVMIMEKKIAFSLAAAALVLVTSGVWWSGLAEALPSEQPADVPSFPAAVELDADRATTTVPNKMARTELSVEPQWIDGIVVDENGAPVVDVEVFLIAESELSRGNARLVNFSEAGREIGRVADTLDTLGQRHFLHRNFRAKWLGAEQVTRSDLQGRFRFRRTASGESRFVGLWSPERGCRYQHFFPDAASIEVVCATWPRVTGRVLTVDGLPVANYAIVIRNAFIQVIVVHTDERGMFRTCGLPPSLPKLHQGLRSYELHLASWRTYDFEDRQKHEFELTADRIVDITLHPVPPFRVVLVDEHDQPWTGERLEEQGWGFEIDMNEAERTQLWPMFFYLGMGSRFDDTLRLEFDPATGALEGFRPGERYPLIWIDQPMGPFQGTRSVAIDGRERIPVTFPKVVPIKLMLRVRFPEGTNPRPEVEVSMSRLIPAGLGTEPSQFSSRLEEFELTIPGQARGRDVLLQVTAVGHAEQLVQISVPRAGDLPLYSFKMRRALHGLQGRVVDEDGQPTQAELMVTMPDGSYFQDRAKSLLISSEGRFRLEQPVDERPVRVFVKHDDYADTAYDWNTGRSDDLVIHLRRGTEHRVTGLQPGRYHFRVLDITGSPLGYDELFGATRPHDTILLLGPRAARVEARRPGIKTLYASAEVGEKELQFHRFPSNR